MATEQIVAHLNAEIDKLTRARDVLLGHSRHGAARVGTRKRRPMSPETKRKIASAMKKRWAAKHK
jgi:hypothetical protein